MNDYDIIGLGLGIIPPGKIVGQILDTNKKPHELRIKIKEDRGAKYPCHVCGKTCRAHDFKEKAERNCPLICVNFIS